jgi:hypothetical protein
VTVSVQQDTEPVGREVKILLRFDLPDEQAEFDAARLGRDALLALWEIDQHCRAIVKHGDPSEETRELAEAIRAMISDELREA